jgi:hypothetical protein
MTVDPARCDISAYTTGDQRIYVVVTMRGSDGAPVPGLAVRFDVTDQATGDINKLVNVTPSNPAVTDANGQVFFTLSSKKKIYDFGKAVDTTDSVTLPQTLMVDLPTAKY